MPKDTRKNGMNIRFPEGTDLPKLKSKLKKKAGKNGTVNGYLVELIKNDLK